MGNKTNEELRAENAELRAALSICKGEKELLRQKNHYLNNRLDMIEAKVKESENAQK